jgi:capsular polysaccharide biosynthesis protein
MLIDRHYHLGLTLLGIGLLVTAVGLLSLTRPQEYQSRARIKLPVKEAEGPEAHKLSLVPGCDLVECEFELIQSEAILSRVVDVLDLNSKWGKRFATSKKLRISDEIIPLLRQQTKLRAVPNSGIVEICFIGDDPQEAARIANTIAEVYHDWRCQGVRKLVQSAMTALEKQLEVTEQKIKKAEGNLEQLSKESNISPSELESDLLKTNFPAYSKAKTELDEMQNLKRLLAGKLQFEQAMISHTDLNPPDDSQMIVLERAVPMLTPYGHRRQLGGVLALTGLAILLAGVYVLSEK